MLYCANCSRACDDNISTCSELMDEGGEIHCPTLGCAGILFDLDENIIPLVQMLYSHGIDVTHAHTQHICQGKPIVRGLISFPILKDEKESPAYNFIKKFIPPDEFEVVMNYPRITGDDGSFRYIRGVSGVMYSSSEINIAGLRFPERCETDYASTAEYWRVVLNDIINISLALEEFFNQTKD